MSANYKGDEHQHSYGQLAYASKGIMKLSVPETSFIIPPQRAIWLPENTPHIVSTRLGLSFRSLYIDNSFFSSLPKVTTSINVDSLLRALILKITQWPENYQLTEQVQRLLKVLIDQIQDAVQAPLFLTMPSDKRLLRITETLNKNPADNTTLEKWSETIGATSRTLNRIFLKQTNMGFVEWRQRLRILYSLDRIERDENIGNIAVDLGYKSSSAFITMFKKHLGQSPRQYFKHNATEAEFSTESIIFPPETAA